MLHSILFGRALWNMALAAAEAVPEALVAASVRPKSARPASATAEPRADAGAPRAEHLMRSQSEEGER